MGKRRARGSSAHGHSHSHKKRGSPKHAKKTRQSAHTGVPWGAYDPLGSEIKSPDNPSPSDQVPGDRPVETVWEPYRAGLV